MKSRILLMIFLAALGFNLSAQPLHWTESLPASSTKLSTIVKDVDKTDGSYSMKYTFTDPGTVFLKSETFAVTSGSTYSLSCDYLDNDPQSRLNTRIYFFNQTTNIGTSNSQYMTDGRINSLYTAKQAAWQTITTTGTTPTGAVLAMVVINMNPLATPGVWGGTATFKADNFKYTEGTSTANKIVNPSFEEWPIVPGSTLSEWKESLVDQTKTSTIVNESTQKTEGFNSVKYTFTDPGTPYLYSNTFNVTAGSTYNFSIDYLDNDPAGVISARLWFYASPEATTYLDRKTTPTTVDSPNWQTISYSGTTPAGATIAYIALRMSPAVAATFTSATYYADNAKYTEGSSTTNLIKNPGFEDWLAPSNSPEFTAFKFAGLTPNVVGVINKTAHTVALTVPYPTDITTLVSTFTLTDGTTAKVGTTAQVSGTTPNNFTSPVTYTLTKGTTTQDWVVTVTKTAATTGKDILSFKFEGLTPAVTGVVAPDTHKVSLEVPAGTNVTALVPTIILSPNATVAPLSGVAANFTSPLTYTVTAQDASTQAWVVTVSFAVAGQTTLFLEDFENVPRVIKPTFTLINQDKFPMAAGEERWAGDSCWLISSTTRPELAGTHVALASSYVTMPITAKVARWMILPAVALGGNSTLSWQALSTTVSGNYPDDYTVYIAPAGTGLPTVGYFEEGSNVLLKVAPENWSAAVGRPGAGLGIHSVNLKNLVTTDAPSGWFNRSVWIAFVLNTDLYTNPTTGIPNGTAGGSALAIDNIKIVNNPSTGIIENKYNSLDVSVSPNPTSGKFKLSIQSDNNAIADIRITDLIGHVVFTDNVPLSTGLNQTEINLSNLPEGIYMVRTTTNGKVNVSKLIIK